MADITKIKPLGSTTEYTLNARILGQTSSTTATDKGGLTWNNISGKQGTTINAYDTPSTTDTWWYILRNRHTNTTNNYYTDVAIPFNANSIYYKRVTGSTGSETIANASTNNGWVQVLDQLNYNNYAPTKEGVGASGTWNINITGTATNATNDSDGNAINTTYLKKSGGTMTGNINRYYSAASTDPMITAISNNQDVTLFTVGHGGAAVATTTSNHYKLLYKGTNSSPNNYLQLIAHGSADKVAMQIDENANVSFTNKVTADISGNAATVTVTKTTPTDKTTYYPVYTTSTTTGAQSLRNDTRFYYYDTGTTSYLNIGNSSNSGGLTLHNANGKYGDIVSSAFTDTRTFTLPDKTGTFALTSDLDHILHIELTDEDLNTINPNDVTYYFGGGSNTCTNKPSGVTSFGMVVYRIATGYKMQELTTSGGIVWRRIYDGTNQEWKDWYRGDNVVKQNAVTASSYSNWRPLIIGASSSATEGFNPSTTTDEVYTVNTLTVQPSTGTIRASIFKGNLSGTATNANYLNLYEARGTTTTLNKNANYVAAGAMFHLVATSSTSATDNGKTATDANILQMNWDTNSGYDSQFGISASGNRSYFRSRASQKTAWREYAHIAMNTKTGDATIPVYVAADGKVTAVTANSVLTDLASTAGASIYAASPRPGVTGTLPVAHGGTGKTTELEAITNLGGIYWKTQGNLISNVDLNTYNATNKNLGTYYSNISSNTATLTNSPISGSGFKFLALGGYGTTRGHQIAWGTTSTPYLRTETGTAGVFTNWAKLVYNNTGAAVGGTGIPIYVTADGETKEITSLSIDHGGTGATTIDEAANNLQVWYLGSGGTAINSSTDLNTLKTIGNYYCGTTGKAKTCLNTPWGDSSSKAVAFTLKISDGTGAGTSYLRQELIPYNAIHRWIRWSTDSGTSWQPWKSIGSSIYQSTTIADDTPATLSFITHQTDNNIETVASIKVYDDHDAASNGTNMVFRSGGQMVIGSGESPTYLYDTVLKGTTGERMWVTSDSDVRIYSNCNTIANRIGVQVGTSGQLVPIKSETANSYAQDLGSDTARWKTGYIGAFTIGGGEADSIPSKTISSNSTFYIDRAAGSSIIFSYNGANKIWIDQPNNNLRPDQPNTLSIGTSSYKWADAYITTTHGNLDGNASTATKWETARTLTIGYKGQTVDGSADVTWDLHDILKSNTNISTATSWDQTTPGVYYVSSSAAYTGTSNPESNTKDGTAGLYRYGQLIVSKAANGGLAQFYIAHNDSADNNKYGIHFRTGWNGNYLAKWRQLIDSGNYTNWTVTKTGDGASGTWGISITGNAATATAISTTGGTTAKFWRGDNTWSSELTDKLTVKHLTISGTEADEHLKFSRANNPNYIIAPLISDSLSGSIAIGSSTSQRSFRITKDDISPYDATATATSRLGTQALPWKELFILAHSSSANVNGIQFSDKTAVKGRLGVNTSGGVGLYGAASIYLRPSLTATDIGLIINTDKTVVPGADSTHSLGSTALHWQHGYYDDLFVSTNTTYTTTNSATAGTAVTTGYLDLTNTSPAIRLHRASAAAITGQITSDANAGLHLTGTAATTATTYNGRSISPLVKIDGSTYVTASIETSTYFMSNTTSGSNTGYYLRSNNVDQARLYVSTIGTAAAGTTTTDPDTGESTTTYANTTGETILQLGNATQGTSGYSNSGANNARGRIRFYGTGTKYTDLIPAETGTNGNYTQYLPQASGYLQANNSTVATSMSPSNWTIANWNMSGEYYIPGVNAVGVGQLSDVARLKRRIYAAASSNGYSDLYLGNNIPQGTAGNAHGGIVLYGTGTYYTYLRAQPNTANRNCYLPNYAGDTYLAHTANNNAVGGATTMPVYVDANGRLTAITSVNTAHGGTGNIGYTANRLVYSESATKLSSATSLYATSTALSVNNTSISSGINFQVTGNSLLDGITTMTGRLNIQYDDGDNTKLTISHPAITKGTVPTATTYSSLMFLDSSSNPAHAIGGGRLTMVESATGDNYNSIYMRAYIPSSASNNCADIKVTYNADGTSRAESTAPFWGAVWNDYAECRETKEFIEPGRCIRELGDDTLELTTERLQRGCEIVSDTFGFAIGETEKAKTPTATSGRVLAYLYENREIAKQKIGWPVCSGPNGTVSIMTEEEEEKYPSRIIGTISAVPDYDVWYGGNNGDTPINVNGRIWIRIR